MFGLLSIPRLLRNLTDAQCRTATDEGKTNIHAALTIYRVYLMSIITDIYGDVPCYEAEGLFGGASLTPAMIRRRKST